MSNKELVKAIQTLTQSVKSIQDDLLMLKRGATHNGSDPQSSGTQQSNTDVVSITWNWESSMEKKSLNKSCDHWMLSHRDPIDSVMH